MNVTQEIKSRLDIVDIVSETVTLRKSGRTYTGFCPFHQNTRTPAFVVFPDSQTWRCFGACAEGGDLFSFVMKKQGWDFREALEQLAARAGVVLEEAFPADLEQRAVEERLAALLAGAADYFHQLLLHAPQAVVARDYVSGRALTEQTLAEFKVGYALESWDACRNHFNAQGYNDDELVAVGLLTENPERNTRYDRFRNRLMIPIRDVNGQVVGFGARTLDKDGVPKYLNSPQTALFDKSQLLFGLDMARRHIREARQAVIVEAYMDLMQGWQLGFRNLVAQMGTALTETQLRLLKRFTRRFVIALDADAAGARATMRSLDVARETLDRTEETRFDAPHLVRHEGRLQADIRVVTLPAGNDPDKIIRENPTLWPQLVAQAQPVAAYVIDVLTRDLDLEDAKAKSAVAQQVLPLIQDMPDAVERDHYRQLLARTLRVDERALQQLQVTLPGSKPARSQPPAGPTLPSLPPRPGADNPVLAGGRLSLDKREAYILYHCLREAQLLGQVGHRLLSVSQKQLELDDFTTPEDRALLRAAQQNLRSGAVATIDELCDSLDASLRNRVLSWQADSQMDDMPSTGRERLPDKLAQTVLDLRLEKIRRLLSEVQLLLRDAQNEGNEPVMLLYRQQLAALPTEMQRINRAKSELSLVNRRKADAEGE